MDDSCSIFNQECLKKAKHANRDVSQQEVLRMRLFCGFTGVLERINDRLTPVSRDVEL